MRLAGCGVHSEMECLHEFLELLAAVHVELGVEVARVGAYGAFRQTQCLADLHLAEVTNQKARDVDFAACEIVMPAHQQKSRFDVIDSRCCGGACW